MALSPNERSRLLASVERHLAPRRVDRAVLEGAVDRVLQAMPVSAEPVMVTVVAAAGLPDLASRLRAALPPALRSEPLAVASEGRHTVVVARVPAANEGDVLEAAGRIGARAWSRGAGG